jgi:hypothetical protein
MSRVSYQVAIDRPDVIPPAFEALDSDAIDTRKRDAKVRFAVDLSKRQARWLKTAGTGDPDAVLRALVDLGMQLRIDWSAVKTSGDLRAAVREAVLIRHRS